MTTYDEAKQIGATIEAEMKAAGEALKPFPKGPMGLTPDAVRATPEWQAAKARVDRAFARLRQHNQSMTKTFAREMRAERKARGR